jgi:hypothetical protein
VQLLRWVSETDLRARHVIHEFSEHAKRGMSMSHLAGGRDAS